MARDTGWQNQEREPVSHLENQVSSRNFWRTYTGVDGLPGGNVHSIITDSAGYVWIATDGDGASKYDGERFNNYTVRDGLSSDFVRVILEDSAGDLWFGTWGGGVCKYDGARFSTRLTVRDGLSSDFVTSIAEDSQGNLWFGTWAGVSKHDGNDFVGHFTTENGLMELHVESILATRSGTIWIGTFNGGIYTYNGKSLQPCFPVHRITADKIYAILEDRNGNMCFGTLGSGILKYDGRSVKSFSVSEGLADNRVMSIFEDRGGNLWFGTAGGVSWYDGNGFHNFTTQDGLVGNVVNTIAEDKAGNPWFGTWGDGICMFDRAIQIYPISHRIKFALERENGELWFTTWEGDILRYNDERFENVTQKYATLCKPLADRDGNLEPVVDSNGHVWFGGLGYISRFDGETFHPIGDGSLTNRQVYPIFEDSSGNIWVDVRETGASRDTVQIGRYDGTRFHYFPVEKFQPDEAKSVLRLLELIITNTVVAALEDRVGNMWFGTPYTGVYKYDGVRAVHLKEGDGLVSNLISSVVDDADGNVWLSTIVNDKPQPNSRRYGAVSVYNGIAFQAYGTKQGLGSDSVRKILRDRNGHLWFATWHGGVSRYNGENFENFTTEHGLASNTIKTILEDRAGDLWFGTQSAGVSRCNGKTFQTLTTADGLISNTATPVLADGQGNIWFSHGGSGLTRYTPFHDTQPTVSITRVVTEQNHEWPLQEEVTSMVSHIVFHYKAVSLKTQFNRIRYTYKLEGHDNDWNPTTNNRIAEYEAIEPGNYVFKVKAIDRDLNESEPVSVALRVLRSSHLEELRKTRKELEQAYIVLAKKNEQLAEAQEEAVKANRAKSVFLANMSHDIRTPMHAILGYAQILQRDPELQKHQDALTTIENRGTHLLALISDVLDISKIEVGRIELNLTNFDLSSLVGGLDATFRLRCQQNSIDWRIEWQVDGWIDSGSPIRVRGDVGKLQRILDNLLSNALKATESGSIVLRVIYPVSETLDSDTPSGCFEVIDTGIGISPEGQAKIFDRFQQDAVGVQKGGTGIGLTICQAFVELMGGELKVESEVGNGSRFFFTVPLPQADTESKDEFRDSLRRISRITDGVEVTAIVVDDVMENRDVLAAMLRDLGVQAQTAAGSSQALSLLAHGCPEIMFIDVRMPDMNGIELMQHIRRELGNDAPRIVAISASVIEHTPRELLDTGFDAFISKPFPFDRICECLATLLGVTFEFADTAAEENAIDWSDVRLPQPLITQMIDAAEIHRVTRLEAYLAEMDSLGVQARQLANHLRQLIRTLDYDQILEILSDVIPQSKE